MKVLQRLNAQFRRFREDKRGAIAVYVGLAIVPLVGALGLATDVARGYMVQSRLSQAVDAAALAGGKVFTEDYRGDDINKYFAVNFPDGYMGVDSSTDITLTPVYDEDAGTVTLTASATVGTTFLRVLHVDEVDVSARAVVQRAVKGLEVAMVLDVTGSMGDEDDDGVVKLESLKSAGDEFLEALYGNNETIENLWVSVVPVAGRVNFNPNSGWMDPLPSPWNGCGDVRAEPAGSDDTPPADEPFVEYIFGNGAYSYPDDLGCPSVAVLPLTAEKTTVSDLIDTLTAEGQTRMDVGMAWGWRALSPRWRGVWATEDATLPLDYDEDQMDKAIVIMTDGQNQPWDGSTTTEVNDRLADICTAAKADDVEIQIFTIVFDVAEGSTIDNLFEACATTPADHYRSPTGAELEAAFRQIGSKLSNLRLAE